MSEEQFDPRDLNKDGKVTLEEKLRYAAGKAGAAISSAAKNIKEDATEMVGKVKDYKNATPEERKAKNDEVKGKVSDAADKVEDAAKKVFGQVKDAAGKLFKKEEPKAEEPEKPAE